MTELRNRLETALTGRYTIDREIGRGGMAIVYLAYDLRNERDVALKVLRPELAVTLGPERFLQEIRLAANLAHPHILPLHDSGKADGLLFYVMPFVRGESLRDRLEREGQLPLVDALAIAREVASALDYAHRAGVIHRDIKPENILLQEGQAVVSDFGIARAISAAGSRVTAVGTTVGTPDYMSPEQGEGKGPLDGRSDIYSLGCVLFEMLAGTPPAALTPPEGPAAGPLRPRDRLSELTALRPSLPPEVAGIVARMLEPRPKDRFATGAEVAAALAAPKGIWTPRSVVARRRRAVGIGVAATVVLATLVPAVVPKQPGTKVDRTRVLVTPFVHRGGTAVSSLQGDHYAVLLSEAFERWHDVRVVDPLQASYALTRLGDSVLTLGAVTKAARGLGAGLMSWGEVSEAGDSLLLTVGLYDLTSPATGWKSISVTIDRAEALLTVKVRELADSLLLGFAPRGAPRSASAGTSVLKAFYSYAAGQEAKGRWDLDSAARAFGTALTLDPGYPQAHLWLAQVLAWESRPPEIWQYHAHAAATSAEPLSAQDHLLAAALDALGAGQYPEACDRYRQAAQSDSLSFAPWFGLGQCLLGDHAVVPDVNSPTGWSWRASLRAAEAAFEHALVAVPSASFRFSPFSRLSRTIFIEGAYIRMGVAVPPDTGVFYAYPSLLHDTLAFVPIPADRFATVPEPATTQLAIAGDRKRFLTLARQWAREFPDSAQPYQAMAISLELMGALDETGDLQSSALGSARRALALSRTAPDSVAAGVQEVRLLVKLEHFDAARRLAQQLLGRFPEPRPSYAGEMASLAVLLGNAGRAARTAGAAALAVREMPAYGEIPLPIVEAAFRLVDYASVGAPVESIAATAAHLDTMVQLYPTPSGAVRSTWCAFVVRSIAFAYPELHQLPHGPRCQNDPLLTMQRAHARGDTIAVRTAFLAGQALRRDQLPGDLATEHVYHEAWLLLQVGDTAVATAYVARHLAALRGYRASLILDQPLQSGALVRLMALRADLAAQARDVSTARRWAEPVAILWRDADPELQPVVARMRALMERN